MTGVAVLNCGDALNIHSFHFSAPPTLIKELKDAIAARHLRFNFETLTPFNISSHERRAGPGIDLCVLLTLIEACGWKLDHSFSTPTSGNMYVFRKS